MVIATPDTSRPRDRRTVTRFCSIREVLVSRGGRRQLPDYLRFERVIPPPVGRRTYLLVMPLRGRSLIRMSVLARMSTPTLAGPSANVQDLARGPKDDGCCAALRREPHLVPIHRPCRHFGGRYRCRVRGRVWLAYRSDRVARRYVRHHPRCLDGHHSVGGADRDRRCGGVAGPRLDGGGRVCPLADRHIVDRRGNAWS